MKTKVKSKVISTFLNYANNNLKEYLLAGILFIIGIFVGVMLINNSNQLQLDEINIYIEDFIEKMKDIKTINRADLIFASIRSNIFLTMALWAAGTTVIGIPVVLGVILFRGVCLGYTMAAITCSLGKLKGICFCITSLLCQNILFIPAVITLGVSSIKLYKSIIKDRRRENIKVEILRHTIISSLMGIVLVFSSIIENTVSITILKNVINFF